MKNVGEISEIGDIFSIRITFTEEGGTIQNTLRHSVSSVMRKNQVIDL